MTNAARIAKIGEALYGEHWHTPLARFADVNPRTIERIAAAHRDGLSHAAAAGVLAALREELALALEVAT